VAIGNGVRQIGDFAFVSCDLLQSASIGSGVTAIGLSAFGGCASLSTLQVHPANAEYAAEGNVLFNKSKTTLLFYPYGLTQAGYAVPNGVKAIGDFAFAGHQHVKNVTLPSGLETIGIQAFSGCESLERVHIPASVQNTGYASFSFCDALSGVDMENGVQSIGEMSFSSCASLKEIALPESVQAIGDFSFESCFNLHKAHFAGDAPATVGYGVFDDTAYGFAVYYRNGKSGFANPWNGYDALPYDPAHTYAVAFDVNGAACTPPDAQAVFSGARLALPDAPAHPGYYFTGWFKEPGCTNIWDFLADTVTKNGTLYARWQAALPKPASVSARRVSSGSIKLSWSGVAGATSYEVYRSASANGAFTKVAQTASLSYTDKKLRRGRKYFFKVRGYAMVNGYPVYGAWSTVSAKA